jgi:methylmalonyl-CoA mutase
LQVNGFNSVYEETTEFSERIARNQQILLKEESYFDKIIDPAAGSYYIENLTNSIAEEAWKLFLEIDELGGYIKAVRKGFIQNKIKETSNKKDIAIASGKSGILGTNMFPNTGEFIEKDLDNSVFEETNQAYENAEFETLKPYRGTQAFERLRYKTDYYSRENKRPVVFLLTYGNLAMRRARAMFSTNFFGCAGFEIIDNQGFKSVESGIKAAIENNADIVVICSSDDEYATIAPEIYEGLKGKAIIAVAGYPKLIIENLKEKGIKHFIHVKSNVLEDLQKFQAELGI